MGKGKRSRKARAARKRRRRMDLPRGFSAVDAERTAGKLAVLSAIVRILKKIQSK